MTNVVLAVSLAVRFGPFLSSRVLTPYLGPSPFKLSTISKCHFDPALAILPGTTFG